MTLVLAYQSHFQLKPDSNSIVGSLHIYLIQVLACLRNIYILQTGHAWINIIDFIRFLIIIFLSLEELWMPILLFPCCHLLMPWLLHMLLNVDRPTKIIEHLEQDKTLWKKHIYQNLVRHSLLIEYQREHQIIICLVESKKWFLYYILQHNL